MDKLKKCERCEGEGTVEKVIDKDFSSITDLAECDECGGIGMVMEDEDDPETSLRLKAWIEKEYGENYATGFNSFLNELRA